MELGSTNKAQTSDESRAQPHTVRSPKGRLNRLDALVSFWTGQCPTGALRGLVCPKVPDKPKLGDEVAEIKSGYEDLKSLSSSHSMMRSAIASLFRSIIIMWPLPC